MFDLGHHAAFIWAAYGVTFVAVAGLTVAIVADDWRQQQLIAALEKRGFRRRSAKAPAKTRARTPAKRKPSRAKPRRRKARS